VIFLSSLSVPLSRSPFTPPNYISDRIESGDVGEREREGRVKKEKRKTTDFTD
jgi:hypothetical protein